jgi:hypothetical protein
MARVDNSFKQDKYDTAMQSFRELSMYHGSILYFAALVTLTQIAKSPKSLGAY